MSWICSVAAAEAALSAEDGRYGAVIPGGVITRRTGTRLRQRERRSIERRLDARVLHLDRKPEARHRVPVRVAADHPVREAWIAADIWGDHLDAIRATEYSGVDHGVVVADLRPGSIDRGRQVGQPEVLPARAHRPGRRQLLLGAGDVHRIRDEAERNR